MNLLQRFVRFVWPRNEVISTSEQLDAFLRAGSMSDTWAGINLSVDQAMQYAPFGTSVRVLGEVISQLPFVIFKKDAQDERKTTIAKDFHLHRIFERPNDWMTGTEFREWMVRHACSTGDAFALINRNSRTGDITELLPLSPGKVKVEQETDYRLLYRVTRLDGSTRDFRGNRIFHFRGPSDDGYTGINLVHKFRQAIALGLAQERFAANLFSKGIVLSGAFSVPNKLTKESRAANEDALREAYSGDNAHAFALLEGGADFKPMMMTSEAAQLLESRKLQRTLVAAVLRMPLHMIGDYEKATFSNIENLARQAVDYTFMPWIVRMEHAIEQQLMTADERKIYFAKHNLASLLRGNATERAEFYASGIQNGWMAPNEAREKEDMSPREGGDEFIPAENMFGKPSDGQGDGDGNNEQAQNRLVSWKH